MIIFFVCVRTVHEVRRFRAGCDSLPLPIYLSAGFADSRDRVVTCTFPLIIPPDTPNAMPITVCASWTFHLCITGSRGDRSKSGAGCSRVTVREGEAGRIVSTARSSCCSRPIYHYLIRSRQAFAADQLRARAHCHQKSQLKGGLLSEFRRHQHLCIRHFLHSQGGKSQAQALHRVPLLAYWRESRTSLSLFRNQQFVQGGNQAEAGCIIVRHFLYWSSRDTMCPALSGSLVEECSTSSWAVTAVKIVRRRGQRGA
jgi:hypothetical protein